MSYFSDSIYNKYKRKNPDPFDMIHRKYKNETAFAVSFNIIRLFRSVPVQEILLREPLLPKQVPQELH